jgi:hypothetical protein
LKTRIKTTCVRRGTRNHEIDCPLKFIEAEAISRETQQPQPYCNSHVFDYKNQEECNSFETVIGIVVLIRIVLHITVEIDNKTNYHEDTEYNEKSDIAN